jgi:glycosyltransferase involved in cell wall biosynthesis
VFFDPLDAAAMAGVLVDLLADPGRRAELSRAALCQAGKFSWERGADLALESLRRAIRS